MQLQFKQNCQDRNLKTNYDYKSKIKSSLLLSIFITRQKIKFFNQGVKSDSLGAGSDILGVGPNYSSQTDITMFS